MKVTDLRRKLLAALAAGGMLAPSAAWAANLNQNLVVNGDFEHVDLATAPGPYHTPLILDWTSPTVNTSSFAYSHDHSSSSTGAVPNYADGSPPPGGGHWYFNSNRPTGTPNVDYIDQPGEFYQDIDVSTGNTGSLIATGLAPFTLSAYMSSYLNDADYGNVLVQFRNGSGTVLGSSVISDTADKGPSNVWNQTNGAGLIPFGTTTVRMSVYATKDSGIGLGPDGYVDNVDFRVTNLPKLAIVVNRSNGNISLKNLTNSSVPISGYSITSAFEGMMPANWLSITDTYDAGSPGINQVDAAHSWDEMTSASAHTDLSEADLQSGLGATLPNGRSVDLGNGSWLQTPHEDLIFKYISNGAVVDGIVAYINNNGSFKTGDFDLDNDIDAADWAIFRNNQLAHISTLSLAQAYRVGDLTGDRANDHADFVIFKQLYDHSNGAGSFALMLQSVPEPTSTLLVLAAGVITLPIVRRRFYR